MIKLKNIAVFASGSGTNAENMIRHFENSSFGKISVILSNKKDAFVLERAKKFNIPAVIFSYSDFQKEEIFIPILDKYHIDFIILAGFLLKVPDYLLVKYPDRILNIHPSLLPKHGGKGMYGEIVHKEVIASGERESGITIHTIDDRYDCGRTVYQAKCSVDPNDTPESLAMKIHALEKAYPEVAENYFKHLL
jgi:phosphoribosylglycinamide formyltransferase 1